MKKCYFLLAIFLLFTPLLSAQAQTVDLLWQGDGYAPPFYQGRTLWSKQTQITLLAIPHGLGNSASLNYKWTKNGTVLGNAGGMGRNSLLYIDTILSKPQTIKVEILSMNEEMLASASFTATPSSPLLMVYENHPLYGFMFNKEVGGDYRMNEKEVTFAAFPLFFSTVNRENGVISYKWRTNDGGVEEDPAVTYRTPENTSGTSKVLLEISNNDKITQEATKNFLVQFGKQ